jgi:hypothetical protein
MSLLEMTVEMACCSLRPESTGDYGGGINPI